MAQTTDGKKVTIITVVVRGRVSLMILTISTLTTLILVMLEPVMTDLLIQLLLNQY